jgi:hypothetical protein
VSEQDWTVRPLQSVDPDLEYRTEVDGIQIKVKAEGAGRFIDWQVIGFLGENRVFIGKAIGTGGVEKAKADAIRAARRMLAVGITATPTFGVTCCDRLFATREAADQHESEHAVTTEEARRIAEASEEGRS